MRKINNYLDTEVSSHSPRGKHLNTSIVVIITAILMFVTAIPGVGIVMAEDYLETQQDELTNAISLTANDMNGTMMNKVDLFFESIQFIKAPNVKGLKEAQATKKLSDDFEVKVKHNKIKYSELIKESDTLFFGEVEKQNQDLDKVTLTIADADMKDPLTEEMVSLGGRLAWPVPTSTNITSRFGHRNSPGGIGSTNHKGIDIAAPTGTAIIAAKEGEVTRASSFGGYGNCVVIKHVNGYETLYGHMSRICCNVGDKVKPGDIIGRVGSTGWSTGPHLHFSILKNGTYVDPEPYLTGRNYIPPGEEVSENTEISNTDKDKKEEKEKETKATKKEEKKDKVKKETKEVKETEKTEEKKPEKETTQTEPSKEKPTTEKPTKETTQPTTVKQTEETVEKEEPKEEKDVTEPSEQ